MGQVPAALVIGGITCVFCEWVWPAQTRREHHAWRMIGYGLAAVGFAAWTGEDIIIGPLWRAFLDAAIGIGNGVRAYQEYRLWRDAGGPPKRRLRALSERLRARFAEAVKPARALPVPT